MTSTPASLLDRLAQGDGPPADWDRFVDLYTPLLLGWCRRLGLSDADAADFTQDVFAVLVEHLPRFRYNPARSFRAWLKTVLLNAWRKHQRRAAKARPAGVDPDLLPDSDLTALVDVGYREHLVRRALEVMQTDFEPTTWKAC